MAHQATIEISGITGSTSPLQEEYEPSPVQPPAVDRHEPLKRLPVCVQHHSTTTLKHGNQAGKTSRF